MYHSNKTPATIVPPEQGLSVTYIPSAHLFVWNNIQLVNGHVCPIALSQRTNKDEEDKEQGMRKPLSSH